MSRYPLVTPRPCGFDAPDCLSDISRTSKQRRPALKRIRDAEASPLIHAIQGAILTIRLQRCE